MSFKIQSFESSHQGRSHTLRYSDWGDPSGRPIICVHGLTGNGHDFDYIAPALLEDGYRVIAVDLVGRGRSDFLADPLDYKFDVYLHDLYGLIAHLGFSRVDWLGVSLGGLLGMRIAGADNSPIDRLILNDIGPEVPCDALNFIYHVIKQPYFFDTTLDLEKRMRETRGLSWGPMTDEQWRHMAEHNARAADDGRITYAYDPEIARIFEGAPLGDVDLWACWDAIRTPTMVIQGGQSLLLTNDIVQRMRGRGPNYDLAVFEDCGHVPSLMAPSQVKTVQEWLRSHP
jgi:pimeloyl-ACP methyl ester carboxylesterase